MTWRRLFVAGLQFLVRLLGGVLRLASAALQSATGALLWLAVKLENLRRDLPVELRLRRSLRRLLEAWQLDVGALPAGTPRRFRAWNRTPAHLEDGVVRLHVEQPLLGVGQLRHLAARVLGFIAARETIRRILIRNQHLVVELQQERRRRRRRIKV
ncbi:MAG: hypothetical protein ACYC8T_36185, partial [Myxococcaceae bacterium]